jgi:hypothetical protein
MIITAMTTSAPFIHSFTNSHENEILLDFQLQPLFRNPPKITMLLWKTPLIGWIKANMDEPVLKTPNSTMCGGLFRDHLANFCGGFAKKNSNVSVLHVEITAIIMVMEIASLCVT